MKKSASGVGKEEGGKGNVKEDRKAQFMP